MVTPGPIYKYTARTIAAALGYGRSQTATALGCGRSPILAGVRNYHERVVEHYENPRNVGTLDKDDPNVGTSLVGSPACGDVMRLQIIVDDKTGIIKDAKFKTFGCGSAIASSSYATTLLKGITVDEASKVEDKTIAKYLSLPPVKLHCSMLAEDAVKSAIKDWESKKELRRVAAGKHAGQGKDHGEPA